MRTAIAVLVLLSTGAIASAQGIAPAIESEGSQTQKVELVQGTVSVTVDSAGSVSAREGRLDAEGALGVDANGVSVRLGGDGTVGDAGAASPTVESDPRTGVGASSALIHDIGPGIGDTPGSEAAAATPACGVVPTPAALAAALDAGLPAYLVEDACLENQPGASSLAGVEPRLISMLTEAGVAGDSVVSITIFVRGILIGLAPSR